MIAGREAICCSVSSGSAGSVGTEELITATLPVVSSTIAATPTWSRWPPCRIFAFISSRVMLASLRFLVEEPEAIVEQFHQPVVMIEVPMSQPPRIPQQYLGGKAIDSFSRSSAPIILKHAVRQFRAPDEGPLRRQGGATKGFTCMPLCVPLHRIGPSYAPFAASMRIRTATATINRAKPRRRNISGMRSLRPTPSQAPNTAPKIRVGRLPSWIRPVPR